MYSTDAIRPDPRAVLQGDTWRITVLTPRLVRLEYSQTGQFTDSATQLAADRHFPPAPFRVSECGGSLQLTTEFLRLTYDKGPFSSTGLTIQITGKDSLYASVWHYGDEPHDLGGTARTLDEADGAIPLEHGVLSADGWSVLRDTGSGLVNEEGTISPRPDPTAEDLYFFGYGRDYLACLRDFYRLTGPVPLLPRYALGNWWSRYYRYTQSGYLALMDRFRQEQIPFTVAVIDMDWHVTEIDPRYGTGWTGFTWNRELFPDPEAFLQTLHQQGLRTTLNLHPAEGVRACEDCYAPFAAFMGTDTAHEDPIPFRPADPKFMEGYFRFALHPLEEQGVDFWWIDWQQGTNSGVAGLDPLWLLNHYQYQDSARRHARGLIFSRYAGPGSHRYPIGFSGDTIVTWDSLAFQPYFTANASNIGYGWWSHDIGGHMRGVKDDEMALRWLQFGVFSPILRLHSTNNEFNSKEPWQYEESIARRMKQFLRLRHRLIPYLHTMNRRASEEGEPLCQPMYYKAPYAREAYAVPNEYWFGTELVACPITEPVDRHTRLARFSAWLPEGEWTDLFTGLRYHGGRKLDLYRPLDSIPVLAKAGALLPLDGRTEGNRCDNPDTMELRVFAGADGAFSLWEDDGEGDRFQPEHWAETPITFAWGEDACLTIHPARGNQSCLPAARSWRVEVFGLSANAPATLCEQNGQALPLAGEYRPETGSWVWQLPAAAPDASLTLRLTGCTAGDNQVEDRAFRLLHNAQISFDKKSAVMDTVRRLGSQGGGVVLSQLLTLDLPPQLTGALAELLTAL